MASKKTTPRPKVIKRPTDSTDIDKRFQNIWKAINELSAVQADHKIAVAEHGEALSNLDERVDEAETRLGDVEDQLNDPDTTPLADDCACLDEDVVARLSNVEDALEAIQDTTESLSTDFDLLDKDVAGCFDSITDLQNSVRDIESDLDAQQTVVTLASAQPVFTKQSEIDDDPLEVDALDDQKTLVDFSTLCHRDALKAGWWDDSDDDDIDLNERIKTLSGKIVMIHSELSEAVEALRDADTFADTYCMKFDGDKPVGFATEIVDAIIRLFDLAGYLGIDLDDVFYEKLQYNRTRGHRHGGKKI